MRRKEIVYVARCDENTCNAINEKIKARTKKPTAVELLSRSEGKACGECKFFTDENTDGEGLCILLKMPFVKYCGNKACTWFKERMKVI